MCIGPKTKGNEIFPSANACRDSRGKVYLLRHLSSVAKRDMSLLGKSMGKWWESDGKREVTRAVKVRGNPRESCPQRTPFPPISLGRKIPYARSATFLTYPSCLTFRIGGRAGARAAGPLDAEVGGQGQSRCGSGLGSVPLVRSSVRTFRCCPVTPHATNAKGFRGSWAACMGHGNRLGLHKPMRYFRQCFRGDQSMCDNPGHM